MPLPRNSRKPSLISMNYTSPYKNQSAPIGTSDSISNNNSNQTVIGAGSNHEDVVDMIHGEQYIEHSISMSAINGFCWLYGEIRGGTPAQLVGDEYLAFFHSSSHIHHAEVTTVWLGAYTFTAEPPFRITSMSRYPIASKKFSEGARTSSSVDISIFPMSFSFDKDAEVIEVSYGKNEREGWLLRLDRRELLSGMKKVSSTVIGQCDWDDVTGEPDVASFTYRNPGGDPQIDELALCGGPCVIKK
jgi:hypothetical protein